MQDKTLGKLIVIEGGDGLGKSTQYNLLKDYLLSLDYELIFFDFPNKTGTPIGNLIGNFLSSKYGAVSPEFLSLAFAIDRFVSKEKILEALNSEKIVLCDRFVLSNIAFQTSKLEKIEDKNDLEQLLNWLEYDSFGLPKPDAEIIITAPDEHYSKGCHLVRSEDATRSYVTNESADIHEKDSSLQLNVNSYFRNLSSNENRILINSYNEDGSRIEVDEIHKRIVEFVNKILGKKLMNTLVDKFVQINGLDLESTKTNEIVQSLDSNDLSLINKVVDYLVQEQNGGDSVSQSLSQLPLKEKFFLLALLVNKSNDLLLYPADLREKQMEAWAGDLNVSKDLIRAVMIVGGEKILNKIEN